MLKTLNKFQKYIVWAFCLSAVAFVVLALCYMTEFIYIAPDNACPETKIVYPELHTVNNLLLYFGVILLVLFAIVCIVGNKYRKKYYISNLVVGCTASGVGIVFSIVCMIFNINAMGVLSDHYDVLYSYAEGYNKGGSYNLENTWQVLTNVFMVITLIIFGLNLAYTIVKFIISKKSDNSVYLD